jgi:hypothetical protein
VKKAVYATVAIKPINFPNELQVLYCPISRKDNSSIGGCLIDRTLRTWDWVRYNYPVDADKFDEVEGYLKAGQTATTSPAAGDSASMEVLGRDWKLGYMKSCRVTVRVLLVHANFSVVVHLRSVKPSIFWSVL